MSHKKILLVDCDSTIPNLALMRISTHHKRLGDYVTLSRLGIPAYGKPKTKVADCRGYDMAYISAIFDTTPNQFRYLQIP